VADIVIKAPAESCIEAAAALKADLLAGIGRAGAKDTLVFDLSDVRRSDSSLAQLAISLSEEAAERGIQARLVGDAGERALSAMLGCDVSCDACAFKKFHEHTRKASGKKAL
jgi:hypothetical protein